MEPTIVNHDNVESAMIAVQRALQEAAENGKWMAAVWSVEGNELRMLTRTTWQFPDGDVDEAIAQIRRSFPGKAQTLKVHQMGPLPTAQAFGIKAPKIDGVSEVAEPSDEFCNE